MKKDVCQKLREKIVYAYYKPGEPLNEMRLSKEFGISRTPIREALIRLSEENLVTIVPNLGARVADLNIYDFYHLIEVRLILERAVARLAVQNARENHINDMSKLFERVKNVKEDDIYGYVDCDREFHQIIAEAAGNPILNKHLSVIRNQFIRIETVFEDTSNSVFKDLPQAIRLLKRKDTNGLEKLMVKHVERFVARVGKKIKF